MRGNKKKEVVKDIDLDELERVKGADLYSVAALILTVKNSDILDENQIPEWMLSYPVPADTIQCPEDPFKCYAKLLKLQREDGICVHPANQIDTLLIDTSVTVTKEGIAFKSGEVEKTISVVSSYLLSNVNDVERLCHASTADLMVTDAKYSKDGKIILVDWPKTFEVPVSDAVKYRGMSGSNTSGRIKPREEIFSYLSRESNSLVGIRLHTLVGGKLKNFTEVEGLDDQIKAIYKARKATVPANFCTKVVGIMGGNLPWTDSIETAYRMYFKSISIRGGRDGKNVAHGFERFSMSRMNANILNLVTDMKVMLARYSADTILIKTNAFTKEEMRVMVANGISIVDVTSPYPEQNLNVPGVYGKRHPKANVVEFYKIDEDWIKPDLLSKKEKDSAIKFGLYYDSAVRKVAACKNCFAYIYLDVRLEAYAGKISILPSCTADTLKVIIATGLKIDFSIKDLVIRGTKAISCRNRFVHCRKPFCSVDPMAKEVGWDIPIILPKLKCKEQKKAVDCTMFVEETPVEVIPVSIDIAQLRNKVAQISSRPLSGYDAVEHAYHVNQEYLFKIIAGIAQGLPNHYVGKISDEWIARYKEILDMDENVLINHLGAIGDDADVAYKEYRDANYVEAIPFGEDENSQDDDVKPVPVEAPVADNKGAFKLFADLTKRKKKPKKKKDVSSDSGDEDDSASQN